MNKLLKSFLYVAENPKNITSFIWLYVLISILWHNQFLLTFATTQGGFTTRLNSGLDALGSFEYLWVLSLTLLFFTLKLVFNYTVKVSRDRINLEEQKKKTTLVDVDTSNDMQQLISVLQDLKEQLKQAQENEKLAKLSAKEVVAHLHTTQQKLDEVSADFEIVNQENIKLREQLKTYHSFEQTQ
ncbi:hypothetical protein [Thalassotalea marina]|uniref:Uncharacterized protein n=1 Tax=Thalassotalea marina TaxID=1673741 RepID=A0A919BFZ5_9GAMM|nr:hypothetical protein [Thalassotalea marina]GHF89602.1 hypothetical protein GCM10017161_16820 [Thalassotalea marina]